MSSIFLICLNFYLASLTKTAVETHSVYVNAVLMNKYGYKHQVGEKKKDLFFFLLEFLSLLFLVRELCLILYVFELAWMVV